MPSRLNSKKVKEALDTLAKVSKERQVNNFLKRMKKKHEDEDESGNYPAPISRTSVFRILRKKGNIESLIDSEPSVLMAVCDYLELENARQSVKPKLKASLELGRDYFKTKSSRYGGYSLRNLAGNYDMYRRFWRANDKNLFMRSRVKITHFKAGYFLFFEKQFWPRDDYWPNEKYKELNRGFLFPSGESIIAVCETVAPDSERPISNTKFISINDFEPSLDIAHTVHSFSGSGIATSDNPPHLGFGFHCVRSRNTRKSCNIIEIRDINHEILRKILINENNVIERVSDIDDKIEAAKRGTFS